MKLSSLLNPDYIICGKDIRSKNEAINEILALFRSRHKSRFDNDYVLKAIMERESLGGTSFESGIAIPHARLDSFDDILIGMIIPEKSFMDGNTEIKMVVLILTSKTVSSIYLNALAALIKLSRDKKVFDEILSAGEGTAVVKQIEKLNIKVKEEVTVESIMSEEVITVSPDTTIKELADTFYKHKTGYVPVLDEGGVFIGEVNLMILIQEGIPDYATQLGSLNFLKTFEPLERLFRKEDEIRVKDIMKKPSVIFRRDTSIVEASLAFVNSKRRHIPVVENGRVVGILALIDILNRILRS